MFETSKDRDIATVNVIVYYYIHIKEKLDGSRPYLSTHQHECYQQFGVAIDTVCLIPATEVCTHWLARNSMQAVINFRYT
jgi:hypothetical protein